MNARIDFHIHSCLSPCASLDMSPRAIATRAKAAGLDCIALTDHSCTENLPAFKQACDEVKIHGLYGLEVSTAEEVHVLCLFDEIDRAQAFGRIVYDHLPNVINDPKRFGDQPIVTADEEILGFAEKLLINGTDISFFDLIPMAQKAGALCIPAHIDRPMCGALEHLGFLPDLPYDAVEVVASTPPSGTEKWPMVQFSDSHRLEDIGRRFTDVDTDVFTVPALREAFQRLLEK